MLYICHLELLVDCTVQIIYILDNYNFGFVYFPFQLYLFLLHDFFSSCMLFGMYTVRFVMSSW